MAFHADHGNGEQSDGFHGCREGLCMKRGSGLETAVACSVSVGGGLCETSNG
jgi:hypothetical protein